MSERQSELWRTSCIALAVAAMVVGCKPGPPDVEMDTPEETAASVGRILCAEHQDRVEAALERADHALAIQSAKAELAADSLAVREVNERLSALAEFWDDNEDELLECEVVLRDLTVVSEDVRVRVALDVRTQRWNVTAGEKLELEAHVDTVLLTLVRLDGAWKVAESSRDLTLPNAAFGRLVD